MLTPGRRNSRTSKAQSGSARRRAPTATPGRENIRPASSSSLIVSGSGQHSPAAAARVSASWTVLRATPKTRPICRVAAPS
jgi:hypothetical protein